MVKELPELTLGTPHGRVQVESNSLWGICEKVWDKVYHKRTSRELSMEITLESMLQRFAYIYIRLKISHQSPSLSLFFRSRCSCFSISYLSRKAPRYSQITDTLQPPSTRTPSALWFSNWSVTVELLLRCLSSFISDRGTGDLGGCGLWLLHAITDLLPHFLPPIRIHTGGLRLSLAPIWELPLRERNLKICVHAFPFNIRLTFTVNILFVVQHFKVDMALSSTLVGKHLVLLWVLMGFSNMEGSMRIADRAMTMKVLEQTWSIFLTWSTLALEKSMLSCSQPCTSTPTSHARRTGIEGCGRLSYAGMAFRSFRLGK